jgi:NAD-dependent dihydropyrimidine dehydrogenase PreA subunit
MPDRPAMRAASVSISNDGAGMTTPARILYCHCARTAAAPPPDVREAVLRRLAASGLPVEAVPDLCGMAARRDPALKRLAAAGPVAILACAPRAVRWLFHAAGAPLPGDGATILNLREPDALRRVEAMLPPAGGSGAPLPAAADLETAAGGADAWQPWFPVLDLDRCTHCRQCLSFCLFGVYDAPHDRVRVARPEACKTDCPACARVCPEGAILFPKFPHAPVNGAEGGTVAEAVAKVDVSALLGGDVYAKLKARNAGTRRRFAVKPPDRETGKGQT